MACANVPCSCMCHDSQIFSFSPDLGLSEVLLLRDTMDFVGFFCFKPLLVFYILMVVAVNFEKGTLCIFPILSAFMGQSQRAITFIIFSFSGIILWQPLALVGVNSISNLFPLRPLIVTSQEWGESLSFGREKEPADCFPLESLSLRESCEKSPGSAKRGGDVSHKNHLEFLIIKANR